MSEAECELWPFVGKLPNGEVVGKDVWFSEDDFTDGVCPEEKRDPGEFNYLLCEENCGDYECTDEIFNDTKVCGNQSYGLYFRTIVDYIADYTPVECVPVMQAAAAGNPYHAIPEEDRCACMAVAMAIPGRID